MIRIIAKLGRKPVVIGALSLIAITLAAGLGVPAITASAAGPTLPHKNVMTVSGTITGVTSNSITITSDNGSVVGPLSVSDNTTFTVHNATLSQSGTTPTLTAPLTGRVTVVYDSKTMAAIEVMMNMPGPPPAPKKNVLPVSGNITALSADSMNITLTNGSDNLTVGETVIIMPSPLRGPGKTPSPLGSPNKNFIMLVSGNITAVSADSMTIALTHGPGNLTVGETVIVTPSPLRGPEKTPSLPPTPNKSFMGVSGNITDVSGNIITITLTNGSDNLTVGETVIVMPGLPRGPERAPSPPRGANNNNFMRASGNITAVSSDSVTVTLTESTGKLTVGQWVIIVPSPPRSPKETPRGFGGWTHSDTTVSPTYKSALGFVSKLGDLIYRQ
jgi:outer membrane scaffolding protein for murein synthesis (MipA/OmpV family)